MKNKKIIIRYILFQMPELILLILVLIILSKFINLKTWLIITIVIIWIAKDITLFPKMWKAYDTSSQTPMEQLISMDGIVMDNLNPVGYVKVKGELWKAEIRDTQLPAKKGDSIKVIDAKGMLLIVKKVNKT